MKSFVFDNLDFPVVASTSEGYLKGEAIVTRTGVFKYMNQDGTFRYELRHPDEVFDKDSLESLKSVPITIDHPIEFVNAENSSSLMVGLTGESVKTKENFVISSLKITDTKAVNEINGGKQELSMAYSHDRLEEVGVFEGEAYTHKQTNIRYNHLAIVNKGRAGRSARIITMDGIDYSVDEHNNQEKNIMEKELLETIADRLTSVESKLQENNDAASSLATDEANKKIDLLKGEIDGLKTKLAEASQAMDSIDENLIQSKVKERVAIMVKAKSIINLDSEDDLTNREIMEKVIKASSADEDLSDKSDEYIVGRFEGISSTNNDSIVDVMSNITTTKAKPKVQMTLAQAQEELRKKNMESK